MRQIKLPAIVVAVALQLFPIARTVSVSPMVSSTFAIIFRWAVGGAVALESYDACSGGSVYFTCPNTATGIVGKSFNFKLTIANAGSDKGATFAVSPLPGGLVVSNHDFVPVHGVLYGVPTTATNAMRLRLAASYPGQPSVSTNITLTILPASASGPQITNQPASVAVIAGQDATFTVGATGSDLNYEWRKNGTKLLGATSSSLTLPQTHTTDAGDYSAVVGNTGGSVTSTVAHLTVNLPPPPVITVLPLSNNHFQISFTPVSGLTNTVLTSPNLVGGVWTTLTNIPPPQSATPLTIIDEIVGECRVYRVRVEP